jgi:hypothetical protein
MRDDRLQGRHHVRRRHHRVGRAVRLAAVPAPPAHHDLQAVDRGHERSGLDAQRPHRQLVPQVNAEHEVDALERGIRDRLCPAFALLGRLEEHAREAGQGARAEQAGRAGAHRDVTVVAAGVHRVGHP